MRRSEHDCRQIATAGFVPCAFAGEQNVPGLQILVAAVGYHFGAEGWAQIRSGGAGSAFACRTGQRNGSISGASRRGFRARPPSSTPGVDAERRGFSGLRLQGDRAACPFPSS